MNKKIISLCICLMYLFIPIAAFADIHLYNVENVQKNVLNKNILEVLNSSGYSIVKTDPYYAFNQENSKDYITVITHQSGANTLYYYNSSENKKINKKILKLLDDNGISYSESENSNFLALLEREANTLLSNNTVKIYNFEDNTPVFEQESTPAIPRDDSVLRGYIGEVAIGTPIATYLQTPINTSSANVGDRVTAILTQDWVYKGYVIAPQGSILNGALTTARKASYGSRNGRVVILFTELTTADGQTFKISTEEVDFSVTNDGKFKKTVGKVATGALLGALGGLLVAAMSSDVSTAAAVLIGAGAGAATGGVSSAAEKGVDAEIPVYTELEVKLSKPFRTVFKY